MSITLYSSNCPKCKVLKKKLYDADISFTVNSSEEDMNKKGFMSVPILDVDGHEMYFSEAIEWIKGLK